MLLMDEFAIARPRFIVAFGALVRWKLERLPVFKQKPEEEGLHWGVLPVATRMLTSSCSTTREPSASGTRESAQASR